MTDRPADGVRGVLLPEGVYQRALEVGRRASGVSGPNPPVGCLIVRDGLVVAEGSTRPVGGPHAEVVALEEAGQAAAGAIAVVTLEPCAHEGRTPPCVDALLDAGVAEVQVLLRDPDPVARGGIERLAAAGVRVVEVGALRPDLAAAAAYDLRGFLSRVRSGRPHVALKLAQTSDGRTVPPRGAYLTGEAARREVHALRARSDAVLVGGATVRADDPRLDVRHAPVLRQPVAVVLSASGDVPSHARALREGSLVIVSEDAVSRCESVVPDGALVVGVPSVGSAGLDVGAALRLLLEHRILTVLAEPGVRLATVLLDAGLVDAIELHVAEGARADRIVPAIAALAALVAPDADVERVVTADGDLILRAAADVIASSIPLGEVA